MDGIKFENGMMEIRSNQRYGVMPNLKVKLIKMTEGNSEINNVYINYSGD